MKLAPTRIGLAIAILHHVGTASAQSTPAPMAEESPSPPPAAVPATPAPTPTPAPFALTAVPESPAMAAAPQTTVQPESVAQDENVRSKLIIEFGLLDPLSHRIQFGRNGTEFNCYLGGGATGTSKSDAARGTGDGYTSNWLHFLTSTVGVEVKLERLFTR